MAWHMPWAAPGAWGQQGCTQGAVMGHVGHLCAPGVAAGERLVPPAPQTSPSMDRQWSLGALAMDLTFPVHVRTVFCLTDLYQMVEGCYKHVTQLLFYIDYCSTSK